MTSANFVNGNHSIGINSFHFEWCPKYRYVVLDGGWLRKVLKDSLITTAKEYNMQMITLEIGRNHVHLFVNLPPTMSVSLAFQYLKGRSAKDIFAACPSFRTTYRKGHFWSRGKFYRSVSNVGADTVYRYISEHRSKELQGTIRAAQDEAKQLSLLAFS